MKSELQIGKILKPRGLVGEVKVQFYSSSSKRYKDLKKIKIDDKFHEVDKISLQGEFGFIKFKDIVTVEEAELVRNKELICDKNDLPALDNGTFYIVDIIGIDVYADDRYIGKIFDVLQYGAADVYCVKNENSTLSFPAIKTLIKSIDLESNKMCLDAKVYDEVVVIDD